MLYCWLGGNSSIIDLNSLQTSLTRNKNIAIEIIFSNATTTFNYNFYINCIFKKATAHTHTDWVILINNHNAHTHWPSYIFINHHNEHKF